MKKIFIQTAIATSLLVPMSTYAQTENAPSPVTTTCAQASIEKRDTAIAVSRSTYSASMAIALTARKDAEKAAVILTDKDEKKSAIKAAVLAYKNAAKSAQEELTTARKAVWTTFEDETKNCKNMEPQTMVTSPDTSKEDKTVPQEDRRKGSRDGQEDRRMDINEVQNNPTQQVNTQPLEDRKTEIQKIRDSFKLQMQNLRSLFN